jgi:DNA-binding transcriptional LysR family regulator
LQGFGLVQMPRFHAAPFLAQGSLIELLPTNPPPPGPVSLLYPRSHHVPLRVRVFLDWVTQSFARAKHQG